VAGGSGLALKEKHLIQGHPLPEEGLRILAKLLARKITSSERAEARLAEVEEMEVALTAEGVDLR